MFVPFPPEHGYLETGWTDLLPMAFWSLMRGIGPPVSTPQYAKRSLHSYLALAIIHVNLETLKNLTVHMHKEKICLFTFN
jgi:hypothetical protein